MATAFKMSFTDDRGTTYANSVWVLEELRFFPVSKVAYLSFTGYGSAAIFNSGNPTAAPLGRHVYANAPFATIWNQLTGATPVNPITACMNYAAATKDLGPYDANGNPTVGFFDNATQV